MNTVSNSLVYAVIAFITLTGTVSQITITFTNYQEVVTKTGEQYNYQHPIFMASCGFIVEFLLVGGVLWPISNF